MKRTEVKPEPSARQPEALPADGEAVEARLQAARSFVEVRPQGSGRVSGVFCEGCSVAVRVY